MVVTDAQVDSLKEDVRVIGDTVSELVTRVAAHDRRFDQVDGRLDGIDGRLDGIDGRLDGIDGRLDGIDGRFDGIDGRLGAMDGRLGAMDGRLGAMDGRSALWTAHCRRSWRWFEDPSPAAWRSEAATRIVIRGAARVAASAGSSAARCVAARRSLRSLSRFRRAGRSRCRGPGRG